MLGAVFQTATVLDDLFEGDTGPSRGSDGALTPRGVDQLIAVARVLTDLLNPAGAGALERDDVGLAREESLILEVGEGQTLGFIDETANVEEELLWVNLGNSAVVSDEEIFVVGDFLFNKALLVDVRSSRPFTCTYLLTE